MSIEKPDGTILILGGTREAALLAGELVSQGHDVITSLAGRTREPAPLAGAVRTGGFGGAHGLAHWLLENRITRLIDATHPFALQISAHAEEAARKAGIPLDSRIRPPWKKLEGDIWQEVGSIAEAATATPSGARALLALGSQHIAPFFTRDDVHFVVRMVDAPAPSLPLASHTLILGRPNDNRADEATLLRNEKITHIICRNSGGRGAYAKIEAARQLDLPVIMIGRKDK